MQEPGTDGKPRAQINGQGNELVKEPSLPPSQVLFRINQHRLVEHQHVIQRALFRAFPFVMDNRSPSKVVVLPSPIGNPDTQVDVLAVHEVAFVQQSHFVQCRATHPHERPGQHFNFCVLILGQVAQVISVHPLGTGIQPVEPCDFPE